MVPVVLFKLFESTQKILYRRLTAAIVLPIFLSSRSTGDGWACLQSIRSGGLCGMRPSNCPYGLGSAEECQTLIGNFTGDDVDQDEDLVDAVESL